MRALETFEAGIPQESVERKMASADSGRLLRFPGVHPDEVSFLPPPAPFQFHDGTPEGEAAYFESVGRA